MSTTTFSFFGRNRCCAGCGPPQTPSMKNDQVHCSSCLARLGRWQCRRFILLVSVLTATYVYHLQAVTYSSLRQGRIVTNSVDKCPCITRYLDTLENLGITNGNMAKSEWRGKLCLSPGQYRRQVSDKPIIIGVGPGTTATRSFALAVSLLGKTTLHWGVVRTASGAYHWKWNNTDERVLDHFGANELILGFENRSKWESIGDTFDFVRTFEPLDALFDDPFNVHFVNLLHSFPNAKVIMTHRDPFVWYEKRLQFCSGKKATCSVPFMLRPFNVSMGMHGWTKTQGAITFAATEEVIRCLVDDKNYLQVDAWNPPEGGWMPVLAKFIGVSPVPTQESQCTLPLQTDHNLMCERSEMACKQCDLFFHRKPHRNGEAVLDKNT